MMRSTRRPHIKTVVVLSFVAIVGASVTLGGESKPPPSLEFVRHGKTIPLADDLAARVVQQLEKIGRTCVLNSRQHEYARPKEGLGELRDRILSNSYVKISYAEPVSLRPAIEITELIQATPDGNFVGALLTRHDSEIIAYAKCGGLETLQLMCLKGLAGHFPKEYGRNCHIVQKAIEDGQLEE